MGRGYATKENAMEDGGGGGFSLCAGCRIERKGAARRRLFFPFVVNVGSQEPWAHGQGQATQGPHTTRGGAGVHEAVVPTLFCVKDTLWPPLRRCPGEGVHSV